MLLGSCAPTEESKMIRKASASVDAFVDAAKNLDTKTMNEYVYESTPDKLTVWSSSGTDRVMREIAKKTTVMIKEAKVADSSNAMTITYYVNAVDFLSLHVTEEKPLEAAIMEVGFIKTEIPVSLIKDKDGVWKIKDPEKFELAIYGIGLEEEKEETN